MKDYTFDIPAYKFALLKFNDDFLANAHNVDECVDYLLLDINRATFLPFEKFDGLTFDELKSLFNQKHYNFLMVCYNYFEYVDIFGEKGRNWSLFHPVFIDGGHINVIGSKRIDEFIRDFMLENYEKVNTTARRVFTCFLERYCFEDKKETLMRLRLKNGQDF